MKRFGLAMVRETTAPGAVCLAGLAVGLWNGAAGIQPPYGSPAVCASIPAGPWASGC
ncbi:hypothetical protein GCM10020370_52120 [Paenibacillus hodogayensis]